MRVLVIGSGGREHVLVWRLGQDRASYNLHAAPGNPGIASLGTCHAIAAGNVVGLVHLAEGLRPDLTIVGPEAPLAGGIVDALRAHRLRVFGPTRAAARLESSKVFAKHMMVRAGVPTPAFEVFEHARDAIDFLRGANRPLVVKADGLASGKGVVVAADAVQAEQAVTDLMVRRVHGDAGNRILIEERLEGQEASVLAFVCGPRVWPLLPAQDYKRALDGNRGPNTGGMGAIAPAPLAPAVAAQIVDEIIEPIAAAMASQGHPYTGVLYAGVMLTEDGPQVLEFNCRFGDPEAQVILPLLEGDLASMLLAVLEGRQPEMRWSADAAVCVVLASEGYPGASPIGRPITGLDGVPAGVLVLHAATAARAGALCTAGGRVLNVVARGPELTSARARAYAGAEAIAFDGVQFRRDIGIAGVGQRAEPAGISGGRAS